MSERSLAKLPSVRSMHACSCCTEHCYILSPPPPDGYTKDFGCCAWSCPPPRCAATSRPPCSGWPTCLASQPQGARPRTAGGSCSGRCRPAAVAALTRSPKVGHGWNTGSVSFTLVITQTACFAVRATECIMPMTNLCLECALYLTPVPQYMHLFGNSTSAPQAQKIKMHNTATTTPPAAAQSYGRLAWPLLLLRLRDRA